MFSRYNFREAVAGHGKNATANCLRCPEVLGVSFDVALYGIYVTGAKAGGRVEEKV